MKAKRLVALRKPDPKSRPSLEPEVSQQISAGSSCMISPLKLKFHSLNRPTNPAHVQKIKKALISRNLLHLDPIKVTPTLEIIDGQHRVRAALELGFVEVPIAVLPANVHAAQALNSLHKQWTLLDSAHYWAANGRTQYRDFLSFYERTQVPPSIAMEILGVGGGKSSTIFKDGGLVGMDVERADLFLSYTEIFKPFIKEETIGRSFLRAFWRFFTHGSGYNHARMTKKLELVGMTRRRNTAGYIDQLSEIYNYKVRQTERINVTQRVDKFDE